MISTRLTQEWGLAYPLIGAPMIPMAGGTLAAALSNAGALGMIGVDPRQPRSRLEEDVATYRRLACHDRNRPFGIGLMAWALDQNADLLDAAIAAAPSVIGISFGNIAPYAERVRAANIRLIAQVQDRKSARAAEAAGVDLIVAQGTEAGGHTGGVGTLPLLQIVLDEVQVPVVAAGGIATGRGLAAVIAAGAVGAWIGTPLLVAQEARNSERARARIIASDETQTTLTSVFDRVQHIPWPAEYRGRALTNAFVERWHGPGNEQALEHDAEAAQRYAEAKRTEDYDVANLYAGQSVGTIRAVRPAGDIVREIADDAERRLRAITDFRCS